MNRNALLPLACAGAAALLSACSNLPSVSMPSMPSLWGINEVDRKALAPANATAYQCSANRTLYVRWLDGGNAAWVILPEREFRMDKAAGQANRYTNPGGAVLEQSGTAVSLRDGSQVQFIDCKTGGAAS